MAENIITGNENIMCVSKHKKILYIFITKPKPIFDL